MTKAASVVVYAEQELEREALAALLRDRTGVNARPIASPAKSGPDDVFVWSAGALDHAAVKPVATLNCHALVLVVDDIEREAMMDIVAHGRGALAVLRRSAGPTVDDLARAVHEVQAGRSSFDPNLLSAVLVPDEGLAQLTDTEREVAHLVAQGLRNEAIGTRLFRSERTVEKHVTHVFNKLGLCPRQHAHLDRRVATARMVLAEDAGEPLRADALG